MKEFRPRVRSVSNQLQEVIQCFQSAEARVLLGLVALHLMEAGHVIDPAEFSLEVGSLESARRSLSEAEAEQERCRRSLRLVGDEFIQHLASTLALLHVPSVAQQIREAEDFKSEFREIVSFLDQFAEVWPLLQQAQRETAALKMLLQYEPDDGVSSSARESSRRLAKLLGDIRQETASIFEPLQSPRKAVPICERIALRYADMSDPRSIQESAEYIVRRITSSYERVLSHLTRVSEAIESLA